MSYGYSTDQFFTYDEVIFVNQFMNTEKLSADIVEFVQRNSTQAFLTTARGFIALLENRDIDQITFYSTAHTLLIDLYAAGNKLDSIDLKYSSAETDFDKVIKFENKNAGLIGGLGLEIYYWEIFDPTFTDRNEEPGEPGLGMLVDDFADIYKDLKIELLKIDTMGTDEAVEDALWQLKWGFRHHWGQHAIDALRYLHFLYYEGKRGI